MYLISQCSTLPLDPGRGYAPSTFKHHWHLPSVQGTEDKANISQLIEDFHSERFQLENVIADKKIACELLEVGYIMIGI